MGAAVRIARGETPAEAARAAAANLEKIVSPGDHVLVKPNLTGEGREDVGCTVHVEVIEVVLELLRELRPRRLVVAEDVSSGESSFPHFRKIGLDALCARYGAELVDLAARPFDPVPIPRGLTRKEIRISRDVLECDKLIGLTTLKWHHQAGLTVALKNMFSNIPRGLRDEFHRTNLPAGIVDVNLGRAADYTLVDAFVAGEGNGPMHVRPVEMGAAFAGADPVAVDAVAAMLAGRGEDYFPTTALAAEAGLEECDPRAIEIAGLRPEEVAHHLRNGIELLCEASRGQVRLLGRARCQGCAGVVGTVLAWSFYKKGGPKHPLDIAVHPDDVAGQADRALLAVGPAKSVLPPGARHVADCIPTCSAVREAIRALGVFPEG